MSKSILVADDDPDVIQIVTSILLTKGYDVEVARDGQQALQMLDRSQPDLLIIDLMMPVLSGLEVVRRVRRDESLNDLPIIVISAAAKKAGKSEEFFREGLGADDFIAKPFDPLNLLGRVEAVLRMRDYRTEKTSSPMTDPPRPRAQAVSTARVGGVKLDDLPTLSPGDIVKAFIESWNTQDFAVEYHCLAPSMSGGLPQKSYVMRRQQAFTDDIALGREQRVKRVIEMQAEGDTARVVVEREDTLRGRPRLRQEEYALERGERNWQITQVRPAK